MGCPLPHPPLQGPSGHWPRLTFLLLLSPSKQRHNKLYGRQQADDSCLSSLWMTPRGLGTSSQRPWTAPRKPSCCPCLDAAAPCSVPRQRGPSGAPLLPCCFRGDSQTLCLGLPAMRWAASPPGVSGEDALLEEGAQLAEVSQPTRAPQEGPDSVGGSDEETRAWEPQAQGSSLPQAEGRWKGRRPWEPGGGERPAAQLR